MNIITYPNEILGQVASNVETIDEEILNLINEMYTILKHTNALGLAAPQVGVSKRIFVLDMGCAGLHGSFKPMAMINPVVFPFSSTQKTAYEGCLSLGDARIPVTRAENIKVSFLNPKRSRDFKETCSEMPLNGLHARIVQHENDHLNGITLLDHLGTKRKKGSDFFAEECVKQVHSIANRVVFK